MEVLGELVDEKRVESASPLPSALVKAAGPGRASNRLLEPSPLQATPPTLPSLPRAGIMFPQHSDMNSKAPIQAKKEQRILQEQNNVESANIQDLERTQFAAARTLQKSYRGYRARRELKGLNLDPSSRWLEVSTGLIAECHSLYRPHT